MTMITSMHVDCRKLKPLLRSRRGGLDRFSITKIPERWFHRQSVETLMLYEHPSTRKVERLQLSLVIRNQALALIKYNSQSAVSIDHRTLEIIRLDSVIQGWAILAVRDGGDLGVGE
ncbi:hypothetical protein B0H19DRAFT_93889 [Mycena capillaripes]|nr:hypothetical protein B0H19DRAFT_93889 [Mycena capillaripes]